MHAKNGLAGSFRLGTRLVPCMFAFVALFALMLAPTAGAREAPKTTTLLALGDSISFGFSQEKFNLNFPEESPSFFEGGFVNGFAHDLSKTSEVGNGVTIINDACPGETSNGLIGENPALGGKESTEPAGHDPQGPGDFHPCAYMNVDGFPLHSPLSIAGHPVSQLEDALAILNEGHPAHPIDAITLNIGSNDELAGVTECENQVGEEFATEGTSKFGPVFTFALVACIKELVGTVTVPRILENIGKTIGAIDSTAPGGGHYTGPIILLGFYNPNAFILPGSDPGQIATNEAVEHDIVPLFGNVTYANPFPVFNKDSGKSAPKEQEAICKYTEECNPNVQVENGNPAGKDGDVHPSPAGYKELAKLVNQAWTANPAR